MRREASGEAEEGLDFATPFRVYERNCTESRFGAVWCARLSYVMFVLLVIFGALFLLGVFKCQGTVTSTGAYGAGTEETDTCTYIGLGLSLGAAILLCGACCGCGLYTPQPLQEI